MSWMPNVGTVVRMLDGRIAIVTNVSPLGETDEVMFPDGHRERIDVFQIAEMLTEEPEQEPPDLLATLRSHPKGPPWSEWNDPPMDPSSPE
ncbi:MAG: hypothetical protein AAB074_02190 [Planctomycetota bacterium]